MSELQYGCLEVSGAGLLSEMDVFSAASKYALNTPWTFACVCISMAIVFNSTTEQAPDANDGAFSSPWPGNNITMLSVSCGWLVGRIQPKTIHETRGI
jgi:hypothetical protein